MSKSLLDQKGAQPIITRLVTLQPQATCHWGSMSVSEMMFHCKRVNYGILEGKPAANEPSLKQRLLKFLVLRLMKSLPKGIKTNAKFLKSADDNLSFEDEKAGLQESIGRFAAYTGSLAGSHPVFGKLNTAEWRRFVWMHLDYHLRQFGV